MSDKRRAAGPNIVNLQVDGGQYQGVYERMVFTVKHGDNSFELGRLLATAVATETAPTLNDAVMQSHTEYWLIRLDRWSKLQELYADPSARSNLEVSIGASHQHNEAKVQDGETAFVAPESVPWTSTSDAEWPAGALVFATTQPGILRAIAFESTETSPVNAIIWVQKKSAILPVTDVENRTFYASATASDADSYARSLLVPWSG